MTNPDLRNGASSHRRIRMPLEPTLDRGLVAYVAAASAAGVSMLALAQPAEAKIVYTKANHEIAPGDMLNLDLRRGGGTEFTFSNSYYFGGNAWLSSLIIAASGRSGVQSYAAVLRSGARVGPKNKFQGGAEKMVTRTFGSCQTFCISNTGGPWVNITNGYLGLRFLIRGRFHYGWARLNVTVQRQGSQAIYALLTGYAYETTANKPIIAGRTKGDENKIGGTGADSPADFDKYRSKAGTLGELARGTAGLHGGKYRESGTRQ